MKCPKCQYIGFDSGERCRNCGYEFSLSSHPLDVDLPIYTGDEPVGPLTDLSLSGPEPSGRAEVEAEPALAGVQSLSDLVGARTPEHRRRPASPELPLFKAERALALDEPMVAPPLAPRSPLAVRRGTPGSPRRARPAVDEARLNLEPSVDAEPVVWVTPAAVLSGQPTAPDASADPRPAGRGQRLLAVVVDALLLAGIDASVLYFTLRVCGLEWQELALLPVIPFAGYLLLLDGGYSVAFTAAGGQTIGKMAVGIKVVLARPDGSVDDRVPFGQAVVRSAAWVASAVAVGLGFLPLFGAERRGVHDWLAATRVVKA